METHLETASVSGASCYVLVTGVCNPCFFGSGTKKIIHKTNVSSGSSISGGTAFTRREPQTEEPRATSSCKKGVGFHVSDYCWGWVFAEWLGSGCFFFSIHVFVVVRSGLHGFFLLITHHLFFGRRFEKIVEDCRFGLLI